MRFEFLHERRLPKFDGRNYATTVMLILVLTLDLLLMLERQ